MSNQDKQDLLALFRRRCKERHLNITPQRLAIYEILIQSNNHPDAEYIFKKLQTAFTNISLDTVYRTLSTFAELGLIRPVEGYGQTRRYDPDISKHHHFKCRQCHKIVDFCDLEYDHLKISEAIEKSFHVTNVKVTLEGLCDECLKNHDVV
jgi:Fur family peroxide stress response transcriptional regulator